LIHSAGIYYFTKRFLLTGLVLDDHSSCSQSPENVDAHSTAFASPRSDGCWHPKSFDKAVIIVIDALRYDFTTPFLNPSGGLPKLSQNAFTCLYDLACNEPHNAFLRPFIADPLTTTVQCLKGLTIGTLPTFIDAGSNFASEAIEEDNLLYQLRESGRRIVHLGDDTWTALFPGHFELELSKAYNSFVVEDLHTVDNGVIEHIFPLLKENKKNQ
jgi:GPI ethanolamine phosphate transferase 3 subunit O